MRDTYIHPSAVIETGAVIGQGVHVGPFCHIGPKVFLGDHCHLQSHVAVWGRTTIGKRNKIFPFASLGQAPQDLKYKGEDAELIIGDDNSIREYVTMNIGTEGGGMITRIGNSCLFMTGVHVGHDCVVGDRVVMANGVGLGGHVEIADDVVIGGYSAVHQWVHIGRGAMIGGMAGVDFDVLPYALVQNDRAYFKGLNLVGMRRRGYANPDIKSVNQACDIVFGEGALEDKLQALHALPQSELLNHFISFVEHRFHKGFVRPKAG